MHWGSGMNKVDLIEMIILTLFGKTSIQVFYNLIHFPRQSGIIASQWNCFIWCSPGILMPACISPKSMHFSSASSASGRGTESLVQTDNQSFKSVSHFQVIWPASGFNFFILFQSLFGISCSVSYQTNRSLASTIIQCFMLCWVSNKIIFRMKKVFYIFEQNWSSIHHMIPLKYDHRIQDIWGWLCKTQALFCHFVIITRCWLMTDWCHLRRKLFHLTLNRLWNSLIDTILVFSEHLHARFWHLCNWCFRQCI